MAKSIKEIKLGIAKEEGESLAVEHLTKRLEGFKFESENTQHRWTKEDKIALNILLHRYTPLGEWQQGEKSNCSECGALVEYHGRSWFHIVDFDKADSNVMHCSKSYERRSKP